jgi:hypothetical protein
MIRMKSILMVVSCSALLFATGSGSGSGSSSGSGSNGSQSDNEMTEKNKITGTIEEVMPQDSMLVISSEKQGMLDTVKVTEKTKMETTLAKLKKGDRVEVDVMMKGTQKVAKRIRMESPEGSDGNQGKSHKGDTTKGQSDTMQY